MSTTNQMRYKISKATVIDIDRLYSFIASNMEKNFTYFPQEAKAVYLKSLNIDNLKNKLITGNEIILLAESQSQICGFLFGGVPEGGIGTIIWLIVGSDYQGLGIGSLLLKSCITTYQGLNTHKVKLTVHDNRALKFYLREGFSIEGHHPNHWWGIDFYSLAYPITKDRTI